MTDQLWTFDARGSGDPLTSSLAALLDVGMITDVTAAASAVRDREADGSTYVGRGTALPHIIGSPARAPGVLAARCDPTPWGEVDVRLLVFLIAPSVAALGGGRIDDVMRRLVAIGLDAPTDLVAHQQTIQLLTELGAKDIERKRETCT